MTFALNRLIYPPERMMMFNKTGLLLATAIVAAFASAIVVIGASPEPATAMAAFQAQPGAAPADQANTTALWTALISSLSLNLINAIVGMFNTYINFRLKMATSNIEASMEDNTRLTRQTSMAVRGQQESIEVLKEGLADKSNDKRKA